MSFTRDHIDVARDAVICGQLELARELLTACRDIDAVNPAYGVVRTTQKWQVWWSITGQRPDMRQRKWRRLTKLGLAVRTLARADSRLPRGWGAWDGGARARDEHLARLKRELGVWDPLSVHADTYVVEHEGVVFKRFDTLSEAQKAARNMAAARNWPTAIVRERHPVRRTGTHQFTDCSKVLEREHIEEY